MKKKFKISSYAIKHNLLFSRIHVNLQTKNVWDPLPICKREEEN